MDEEEGGFIREATTATSSKKTSPRDSDSEISSPPSSVVDPEDLPRKRRTPDRKGKARAFVYEPDSDADEDKDDADYQMSDSSLSEPLAEVEAEEEEVDAEEDDIVVVSSSRAKAPARKRRRQRSPDDRNDVVEVEAPARRRAKTRRMPLTPEEKYLNLYNRANEQLYAQHPELKDVFEELQSRPKTAVKAMAQPEGLKATLLPFQREGLHWLLEQEQSQYKGGILADEMGMGKTIQTIALLLSDAEREGPTLVVAPTVAVMQWKNEIELYTGDRFKVLIYYGSKRSSDVKFVRGHDLVLTTYAVLESDYRKQQSGVKRDGTVKKKRSVLHTAQFHRIILDEAHNIKDRTTNTSKAVSSVMAGRRWCLSGTPLQNRVGELYSLIRFLRIEPFSNYYCKNCPCTSNQWMFRDHSHCDQCGHAPMVHLNFFNHSMLKHIQRSGGQKMGNESMAKLRVLLGHIMLRRTKVERADDLGLPPRIVEIRRDYFNEEERDLYASIYSDSNRKFDTYVNQGVVLNNYANIFTLITRMRQVADHPDLVLRRAQQNQVLMDGVTESPVCRICAEEAEDAIESKCHHLFCRMCVSEYVQGWTGPAADLECPVCHVGLTIDLTAPAIESDNGLGKTSIVNRINQAGQGWKSSTKIEALVEELYRLRSDRQTIKSIVFSQFTSMLDLIEWRLARAGFHTVKLQGSMSPIQRDAIIKHFMDTPSVEIFLVSLKAGGVALNLCEASQVFIMDPWWNPSVEWQSGDRVHRIGQHRPVKITRFCIEDSIETRIIELQEKKASMVHATIGNDDAAMNRLTPADMQFLFQN